MNKKAILLTLLGLFMAGYLSVGPALARTCYDQYGRPIPCPPLNVILDKKVRLQGTDDYRSKISEALDGQKLFYRIVVTNAGEETIADLKLRDALTDPADRQNVKITSSGNMILSDGVLNADLGPGFDPGETREFSYEAKASTAGMDPGEKKCVDNVVQLFLDENEDGIPQEDEVEATDTATVCIKRGEVLAAKELPETGPENLIATSLFLGYLGFLLRRLKLTRYF